MDGTWSIEEPAARKLTAAEVAGSFLEAGDLVVTKSSGSELHIGKTSLVSPEVAALRACYSNFMQRLRVDGRTEPRFVHYWLNNSLCREQFSYLSNSTSGLSNLNAGLIGSVWLAFSDRAEQVRIADFLDAQTARIDALIAEKERLAQSLSEYQYSYASSLMTRGMNPDAEFESTSFPEIGSIPKHWTTKRLKFLGNVRSGVAKGKDNGEKNTVSLPYLRVANVQDGFVDLTEVLEIEVAQCEAARYFLQKNDVLMNEGGDNDKLGRGTVWEGQIAPCIHQNHVFAVRLFDTSLAEWVARFTSTDAARSYFFLRSKQSTNLASINQSNVLELPVPMPPDEERTTILEEVRRSAKATTELIQHVQEHIERLREYRSSLISAAVTGQLDISTFKEAN
ncbi:MAG: hypothetical protein B7Y41_06260 [Hydrogenophilales bacterium 28-61-23]|nr:MAG: hypothetical protein B7Y41_06260 [Hydrogenophilales bacterium 28-61-23]